MKSASREPRRLPCGTPGRTPRFFDRKAFAAEPVQTLEAALRLAPSVDIRERGGKGAQADISVRGGSFDQTMVLLNGIDFTDARTGHQSHALPVDLDCISSVELLDGLPGVGAFAGAVNVRTAPLRPTYLRFEGAGGQYGYAYANLSGAVTEGRLSVLGAASFRRSDGYRHNTDFSNCNAYVRAVCEAPRAGLFDFQAGYQDRDFGSNGFYAAYNPDQWEHTATALASLRWLRSAGCFSFGASASYRKNFDRYDWTRGTAMNRHNTDNVGARVWSDYGWAAGTTSLGGDYAYNHIFSTNLGEKLDTPHGRYTHADARHTGNLLAAARETLAAFRRRGVGRGEFHALRQGGSSGASRAAGVPPGRGAWRPVRRSRCACRPSRISTIPPRHRSITSACGPNGPSPSASGRVFPGLLERFGRCLLPGRPRHHRLGVVRRCARKSRGMARQVAFGADEPSEYLRDRVLGKLHGAGRFPAPREGLLRIRHHRP